MPKKVTKVSKKNLTTASQKLRTRKIAQKMDSVSMSSKSRRGFQGSGNTSSTIRLIKKYDKTSQTSGTGRVSRENFNLKNLAPGQTFDMVNKTGKTVGKAQIKRVNPTKMAVQNKTTGKITKIKGKARNIEKNIDKAIAKNIGRGGARLFGRGGGGGAGLGGPLSGRQIR